VIEELLSKRKQIRFFRNDVIPKKELIDSLLEKTFNLVPSKQSLMPYHVHIFGPDKIDEKEKLYYLSSNKHLNDGYKNTDGNTQLKAPYVLVFTQRLAWPNPMVAHSIRNNVNFEECDFEKYKRLKVTPSIEIGMFAMILTTMCMHNNIDVSYTVCLPQQNIQYKTHGLNFTDENVYMVMSLGYEEKDKYHKRPGDYKPNIEEVLSWN
jgi:hypothetical protein